MRILMLIVLMGLITTPFSYAETRSPPQRMIWTGEPIPIGIPTGQERMIEFPEGIRYWLPDQLAQKISAIAANGVLYLQAHQSFDTTRIRVQSLTTQRLYLLDLRASQDLANTDKVIVMNDELDTSEYQVPPAKNLSKRHWYERLTRHAAHQLYAPERLIGVDSEIKQTFIRSIALPHFIRDPRIEARVLASWRGGDLFVTAIELRNTTEHALVLRWSQAADAGKNTRSINLAASLRGEWLTASVQHLTLGHGQSADATTTLYLISDAPFFARGHHHGG